MCICNVGDEISTSQKKVAYACTQVWVFLIVQAVQNIVWASFGHCLDCLGCSLLSNTTRNCMHQVAAICSNPFSLYYLDTADLTPLN